MQFILCSFFTSACHFFILSWFLCCNSQGSPLPEMLYLVHIHPASLWPIFLSPTSSPHSPMLLVFITIHFLLTGNHLSDFSILASSFHPIALFHCNTCHNFSTTYGYSDLRWFAATPTSSPVMTQKPGPPVSFFSFLVENSQVNSTSYPSCKKSLCNHLG